MTVPLVWAVLAIMMFNVTDTWFVAQLGAQPLAAMSFSFPVIMVMTSLGIGLMAGTSSVLARVVGEGDMGQVRRLATDALTLAFIISLVLSIIGVVSLDPLFTLMGASPDVLVLIRDYMIIWYAGFVLVLVPMVGIGAVRATGDTKLQARLMMASAVINLILDPLLIFGWLGFPRLELAGAATASIIARFVTFAAGALVIHRMHLFCSPLTSAVTLWQSWKRILHIGLPAAGTNFIIPVSAGIIVALLAGYGDRAVAGYGAATRIEALTLVVFFAMSATIGPFVGQNLGARKPGRIVEALRVSALFCLALGAVIAVVLGLFAPRLSRLFSDDAEVITVTTTYLRIVPWSYGAAGIIMVVNAWPMRHRSCSASREFSPPPVFPIYFPASSRTLGSGDTAGRMSRCRGPERRHDCRIPETCRLSPSGADAHNGAAGFSVAVRRRRGRDQRLAPDHHPAGTRVLRHLHFLAGSGHAHEPRVHVGKLRCRAPAFHHDFSKRSPAARHPAGELDALHADLDAALLGH
jgi:putative MATE family efflux protein